MIARLLRTLAGGVLVAGLVHVVAILLIPSVAPRDAVDRIARLAGLGQVAPVAADGSVLPDLDPFFVHAACAFDVLNGPLEVRGQMPSGFWTVAVFSEATGITGSLEPEAFAAGRLSLVLGRARDVETLRINRGGSAGGVVYQAVPADRGFVLMRAFADRPARRAELAAALAAVTCQTVAAEELIPEDLPTLAPQAVEPSPHPTTPDGIPLPPPQRPDA